MMADNPKSRQAPFTQNPAYEKSKQIILCLLDDAINKLELEKTYSPVQLRYVNLQKTKIIDFLITNPKKQRIKSKKYREQNKLKELIDA